jgi:hypothetical protein
MLLNRLKQRLEVWRGNRLYQKWQRENPEKKFYDYYAEQAAQHLSTGKAHATLGPKLCDKEFGDPDSSVELLVSHGLRPEHVLVDYGCGSLRSGVHYMNYLNPGNYWGMDVADTFFTMGLEMIDAQLLKEKQPNLRVIGDESLREVQSKQPDYLISLGVVQHVPREELVEYFSKVLGLLSGEALAFVACNISDDYQQKSSRTWLHRKDEIEATIQKLGATPEFITHEHPRKPNTPELHRYVIKIRVDSSPKSG